MAMQVEPVSEVWDIKEAIDACFAADTVEGIHAALEQQGTQWARDTLATLRRSAAPPLPAWSCASWRTTTSW